MMYTIRQAAALTGVSEATLRAWERRYGVVVPRRTDSGYRVYDDDAVRTLTSMHALVGRGWAPRHAAEEVLRRPTEDAAEEPGETPGATDPAVAPSEPVGEQDADTAALLEAAAGLDAAAVGDVLDRRFAMGSFESVVDGWLMPALVAVGEAWLDGRVSVAGEHLVAYAVQRRLSAAYEASGSRLSGPRVIVGLPPGARHELGILAFAVAARRVGLATTYVGADLPISDWVAAVEAHDAAAVVIAVTRPEEVAAVEGLIVALHAMYPRLLVGVGGSCRAEVRSECLHLEGVIGDAARTLLESLRAHR
jgi:methanogenic corrinoid protein MtbC1